MKTVDYGLNLFTIFILFFIAFCGCVAAMCSNHVPLEQEYLQFCNSNGYETFTEIKIADMSWQQRCLHPDKPSKVIYRGENGKLYLQ